MMWCVLMTQNSPELLHIALLLLYVTVNMVHVCFISSKEQNSSINYRVHGTEYETLILACDHTIQDGKMSELMLK